MSQRRELLQSQEKLLDLARSDPSALYGREYYDSGLTVSGDTEYGRFEPWLSFFGKAAEKIVKKYRPKTAVDIGCAFGLLTEALVDRGVDAVGFDISEFAISQAREDMRDRLKVHPITEPIPLRDEKRYDLAICIEVLEHLPPEQTEIAIKNLCACADRIIFSSTPDDFDEPTHFNVRATEEWLGLFAQQGFLPPRKSAATYISANARVVERATKRRPFWRSLLSR